MWILNRETNCEGAGEGGAFLEDGLQAIAVMEWDLQIPDGWVWVMLLASSSAGPSNRPSVPIAPFSSFFMGRV